MTTSFRFFRHFDYGLLREGPQPLEFSMWSEKQGIWRAVKLNPFTASMSPITTSEARHLAGGGDVYAEVPAEHRTPV